MDFRRVHQELLDVLAEVVPEGADDDVALLVDQEGSGAFLRGAPDRFPNLQEIVDVPLQLLPGAADPGGAHDEADPFRDVEAAQRLTKLGPLVSFDPAGDAAGAGVVRHQDQVAAGEAHEGGERRPLVAALLLLDLDDHFAAGGHRLLDGLAAVSSFLGVVEVLAGDLLERQEAVAPRPVFDEGGVQARLDADDAALVDVGFLLDPGRGLDIDVDQVLSIDDRDPQLLRLLRVDQHSFHGKARLSIPAGVGASSERRMRRTGRACPRRAYRDRRRPGAPGPNGFAVGLRRLRGGGAPSPRAGTRRCPAVRSRFAGPGIDGEPASGRKRSSSNERWEPRALSRPAGEGSGRRTDRIPGPALISPSAAFRQRPLRPRCRRLRPTQAT